MSKVTISAVSSVRDEGDGGITLFSFTVARSGATDAAATVDFAVSGVAATGLAADGGDFSGGVLPSGTVSFAEGQSSVVLEIAVAGDLDVETDEGFLVSLSNPSGGLEIDASAALGIILGDDPEKPVFVPVDTLFGVNTAGPMTFGDIDGDGDFDLLHGGFQGFFVFYRNTGSSAAPVFTREGATTPFGLGDVGLWSSPVFADIDDDGDLDVFSGSSGGSIVFYRNTGSVGSPTFAAEGGSSPFGLSDIGRNTAPAFVDIDGDGDLDAFVGDYYGGIRFFQNTGTSSSPNFVLSADTTPFDFPNVGTSATINFADLDGDGDFDALVGALTGVTRVFLNVGTAASATFAPVGGPTPFGLGLVGLDSAADLVDIDGDGDLDAFISSNDDSLHAFLNVAGDVSESFSVAALDADKAEGDDGVTSLTFVVTRTSDVESAATLSYTLLGGTGIDRFDFAGSVWPEGTLSFAEGEAEKIVTIAVAGDLAIEGDEIFRLQVARAVGSATETASATGTIRADDTTQTVHFVEVTAGSPVNQHSSQYNTTRINPVLVDIDGDGDLDLFTRDTGGAIDFHRNTGTATAPQITSAGPSNFGLNSTANRAAPAFGDIDGDGDLDAFMALGSSSNVLGFYENVGSRTAPDFVRGRGNHFGLTGMGPGPIAELVDIDGDGDLDLFYGDDDGLIGFFRNVGTAELPWFVREGGASPFGFYDVGSQASVRFADMDGDGDLDAVVGRYSGSSFFRNVGDRYSPEFVAEPDIVLPGGLRTVPALGDLDGDGDVDYVVPTTSTDLAFYENLANPEGLSVAADSTRVVETDSGIVRVTLTISRGYGLDGESEVDYALVPGQGLQASEFVGGALPGGTITFAAGQAQAAVVVDLIADAIPEDDETFVFSVVDPADPDAYHGEITVTIVDDDPRTTFTFVEVGGNFPFGFSDIGDSLHPAFVDIDGDGDFDAFIGEAAGTLNFFRNVGTAQMPQFVQEGGYFPFGFTDVGTGAHPAFADVDGDGDFDAYVGDVNVGLGGGGRTVFFRNVGTAQDPSFVVEANNGPAIDTDVGDFSAPTFVDIFGIGLLDAFVGLADGRLRYFVNTGTPDDPDFTATSDLTPFGFTDVGSNAVPSFFDIDGDLDFDLLVTLDDGTTRLFENIGTITSPEFAAPINMSTFGIPDVGSGAASGFVDIDGDGDLDAFVATSSTLRFFRQDSVVSANTSDDIVTGSASDDSLDGYGGDDTINGGPGNDTIDGGDGDDTLDGGAGDDTGFGGEGNDTFLASEGNDAWYGGPGTDQFVFTGTVGADQVQMTTIDGDTVFFVAGPVESLVESEIVVVDLGHGNDSVVLGGLPGGPPGIAFSIFGGQGDDSIDLAAGDGPAWLDGGAGDDILRGGIGNDSLFGGAGHDRLDGGGGNDHIDGGDGNDVLALSGDDAAEVVTLLVVADAEGELAGSFGSLAFQDIEAVEVLLGGGNDVATVETPGGDALVEVTLSGGSGDDELDAGGAAIAVVLDGGTGDDHLMGGLASDTLSGGAGNDLVEGGDGDDTIDGGAGDDELAGDGGNDLVDYGLAAGGVTVSLALLGPQAVGGGQGSDTLSGFENIRGSAHGDILTGDGGANLLDGGAGDDTLQGGAGDDVLAGGDGLDTASYADALSGVAVDLGLVGPQAVGGGLGLDMLDGIEILLGSDFADSLRGDGGDNTLRGGAGDDSLAGGGGRDQLDGGDGLDWLDAADAGSGIVVALRNGGFQDLGGGEGRVRLVSVENVAGSGFGDLLVGSTGENELHGGGGDDVLKGQAGNDRLLGGSGNDELFGENGDDVLIGGAGDDVMAGQGGRDLVDYSAATGGITANLQKKFGQTVGGDEGVDTLLGIEDAIGSAFDDRLTGTSGANSLSGGDGDDVLSGGGFGDVLDGGDGDDTLIGGKGADVLRGGTGNDRLTGGTGADRYEFATGDGADTIMDFAAGPGAGEFVALDVAGFSSFGDILAAADDGGGTTHVTIDFGGGDSLTLIGLRIDDLFANDFVFA